MYENLVNGLLDIARWYSMLPEHQKVIKEVVDILEKADKNEQKEGSK